MKNLLISVVICLASVAPVAAQIGSLNSLKGIIKVDVIIEDLPADVATLVTTEELKTDVQLRLRQNGFIVSSSELASVYLHISGFKINNSPLLAYAVELSLHQPVMVMATNEVGMASTWSTGRIATVGAVLFRETVRNDVRDLEDKFINAYLSVNPKK
jgi:hypothetical protein